MKKKKAFLICSAVAIFLILLTVILVLALKKDYIQKTKFDHVSTQSYNDVRIVGSEGLLYLCRGDEIVSDGYVSLQSVNDSYAANVPHWLSADDTLLFDYYIARRAQQSQYLLVTADGEEYTIAGDNYSLAETRLPYLIFVNNATGRRAALSLLRLDSDLSKLSDHELTLTPFSEITPVREYAENALYSHLETKDASAENPYAVYTASGMQILSAKSYEKKLFTNGKKSSSLYYVNNDESTVYSSSGEVLAVGDGSLTALRDEWGYLMLADGEDEEYTGIAVFSHQKSHKISDDDLDFSSVQVYGGSLAIPRKDGDGVVLYSALDGSSARYASLKKAADGLLVATDDNGQDFYYLSEGGGLLLDSDYADMTLDTTLSSQACLVFTSAAYDAENDGARHLHVTREGAAAVTVTLEEGATVSRLFANDGTVAVDGVFLLRTTKDGHAAYRLLSPFSSRLFSDAYDRIETFSTAGIVWARGTSFEEQTYTFLDPIGGQIASTIYATDEEFAKLSFEFADCKSILADPTDGDSAVTVFLLRLSCLEGQSMTSSVRYFALYRSIPASSPNFDSGTLRVLEVGKNLVRAEPVSFFPEDNAIVCRNTDFSHVYRLNESFVLSEVAMLPYRVSRIISDGQKPSVKYFEVTTDDGKYGLYDASAAPILTPYYDEIKSADNGHFIVSLRGAMGVLAQDEGELVQLIDYQYRDIISLPDHGYLTADGNNDIRLFDGKNKISTQAIQSYQRLSSYVVGEDGDIHISHSMLISMGGDLWIHNSDVSYRPLAQTVVQPANVFSEIGNTRAIAVTYYQGSSILDVDVIYPTQAYHDAFVLPSPPDGYAWYKDADADTETALPVTEQDILSSSEYIIKIYAIK